MRPGPAVGILVLGLAAAVLLEPAFSHAFAVWSTTEEFSFGFAVVPLALLLAWRQRHALAASPRRRRVGLVIAVCALIVYVIARRTEINAAAGLAVSPLLFGSVLYLRGEAAAKALAFPIGFLAFGLALYRGLLDTLGFALQQVTAVAAASAGALLGLPIARDGLVIYGNGYAFIVSEQCSGMSSLVALLALSSLYVHVARGPARAKALVIAAVLPVVVAANVARVVAVLAVAAWLGQDAAIGFFHGASSALLFALAMAGLVIVGRAAGCKAPSLER